MIYCFTLNFVLPGFHIFYTSSGGKLSYEPQSILGIGVYSYILNGKSVVLKVESGSY
jgi:hypothetical protein